MEKPGLEPGDRFEKLRLLSRLLLANLGSPYIGFQAFPGYANLSWYWNSRLFLAELSSADSKHSGSQSLCGN